MNDINDRASGKENINGNADNYWINRFLAWWSGFS